MVVSITQVEGAAVQLSEARRLATFSDVHHQRLALLMLDNASEVSLRRSADAVLTKAAMYNSAKRQLTGLPPSPDREREAFLAKIEPLTVSQTTIKRIGRAYDALVDFVADRAPASLTPEHAACLKVLHRFWNAAYHRDKVRADVLAPAVSIMFFLCCNLLRNETGDVVRELGATPEFVSSLLSEPVREHEDFPGMRDAVTLSRQVADVFLTDLELDHVSINAALSQHLRGRLGQLDADLEQIGVLRAPFDLDVTLRIVQQLPKTPEEFTQPTPADFWTRPLPVTSSTLVEWRAAAEALANEGDARSALRGFAEIETPLEELEAPVARFIEDIERENELNSGR